MTSGVWVYLVELVGIMKHESVCVSLMSLLPAAIGRGHLAVSPCMLIIQSSEWCSSTLIFDKNGRRPAACSTCPLSFTLRHHRDDDGGGGGVAGEIRSSIEVDL